MELLELFLSFFKIGLLGFGGGYAMMSMIISESAKFSVTLEQFADLNALDMVVPGPIAINSATYVGYLDGGFIGAIVATLAVSLPSLIIVALVMHFINKYRENKIMNGFLYGVKPAAVGLIAAAALTIAGGVLLLPGAELSEIFTNPTGTVSIISMVIFFVAAIANIGFDINPILLTVLAGIAGSLWL